MKCGAERESVTKDPFKRGARLTTECKPCACLRREAKFQSLCPALYADTDVNRLPPHQFTAAMAWKRGPRGLIMLGETGKGKTRIAWQVIRKAIVDGGCDFSFQWFDCIGFGHAVSKHYRSEDAEDWLETVAACGLLFFDDLGKLKMTERAETELFGIIERRCAAKLPIIVTTNDTGDSLASRMTDNRGPALIRRLREFCEPIQF